MTKISGTRISIVESDQDIELLLMLGRRWQLSIGDVTTELEPGDYRFFSPMPKSGGGIPGPDNLPALVVVDPMPGPFPLPRDLLARLASWILRGTTP